MWSFVPITPPLQNAQDVVLTSKLFGAARLYPFALPFDTGPHLAQLLLRLLVAGLECRPSICRLASNVKVAASCAKQGEEGEIEKLRRRLHAANAAAQARRVRDAQHGTETSSRRCLRSEAHTSELQSRQY